MSLASLPRVRPASGQADPGEADDAGALMITLTGDPAQGAIDGRRGARHGLTGSAPPSSTVLQPLLPRVRLRAPRLPDRGLSRRPPPRVGPSSWLMASGMARGASRASCSPAGGQTSRRRRERSGLGCRGRDLEPPPHRGGANFVDAGRRQAFAASLALGVAALPA